MKKIIVSLILAATLTATNVPVMAAQTQPTASESESVSFDEALADLFDNSMTITDSRILEVADGMQNDFEKIDGSAGSDASEIKGLIKSFEAEKAEYFLNKSDCSYDSDIRSEWDRENQFIRFGFSDGENVTELLPKVRADQITISDTAASVDLYEWITIGYQDQGSTQINASASGYYYTLNFTKDTDGWNIASVTDTEQNYTDLEDEGIYISDTGVTAEEADESAEDALVGASSGEDASLVEADADSLSWNYNITDAIEYANTYALNRNSEYTWWGGRGGDCSNFVSQCLYAGGFPLTSEWYKDSTAWISQNDLRAYLLKIKAGELIKDPDDSDILIGNPVWYNWDGKGTTTNHVTICVGTNENGVPIVDSHTENRYHYKWNYGTSATTFMTMQLNQSNAGSGTVYRLYNPNTGEHFYTSSSTEKISLVKIGWQDEGIGWVSETDGGGIPVYRLFNPNADDHHYTTNKGETEALVKLGWRYEGIVAYAKESTDMPLYRLYNPNATSGAHHYTTNKGEAAYLQSIGWRYEGVSWYSGPIPEN